MKERPILFSSPMVRAILDGSKTQTRRIVKPQPLHNPSLLLKQYRSEDSRASCYWPGDEGDDKGGHASAIFGWAGSRLWVREAWAEYHDIENCRGQNVVIGKDIIYRADGDEQTKHTLWKPSIFMPRWASRLTLEIVSVRVERLNDISEGDAKAEGCTGNCPVGSIPAYQKSPAVYEYSILWESINGPGSWNANPWVWCIEFKRVEVSA